MRIEKGREKWYHKYVGQPAEVALLFYKIEINNSENISGKQSSIIIEIEFSIF